MFVSRKYNKTVYLKYKPNLFVRKIGVRQKKLDNNQKLLYLTPVLQIAMELKLPDKDVDT